MARQHKQQGTRDSGSPSEENHEGSLGRESREQLIQPRETPRVDTDTEDPFRSGSPLAVIRRFSRDIEQLCQSFLGEELPDSPSSWRGEQEGLPPVEMTRADGKLIVRAWLAGLHKEDIDVELRDAKLCISGRRRSEPGKPEQDGSKSFRRVVSLPKRVSADAVSAGFDGGVLRIEIDTSRLASSGGRRIEVRDGHGR